MEGIAILIVVVYILFKSRRLITTIFENLTRTAEDTFGTYVQDVAILNGKKRKEQEKDIDEIKADGNIPSIEELQRKLHSRSNQEN